MLKIAKDEVLRSRNDRSFRNLLIDPFVQVRLGLYSILLALIFSAAVAYILYVHLSKFAIIVMALTDVEEEIKALFITYIADTRWWLVLAIICFLLVNVGISIFYTHKLVGPTVAFSRQLKHLISGNYSARVRLRHGDAFTDIADLLNKLAEKLEGEKRP